MWGIQSQVKALTSVLPSVFTHTSLQIEDLIRAQEQASISGRATEGPHNNQILARHAIPSEHVCQTKDIVEIGSHHRRQRSHIREPGTEVREVSQYIFERVLEPNALEDRPRTIHADPDT
jgi:hypothetical protein